MTIVLILSDHGHPLGDHGKFLKGADRLYNEMLRVPFMLRLPKGRHAGERADALVQFHDVLPTLLDLLGFEETLGGMHGRSFRDVLERRTDEHRQAIITGYHEGVDRCIRSKTSSYIERPAGQVDELYNLQEDPREQHNLIETHREEAERLARSFGRIYRSRRRRARGIQGKYELSSSGLDEPVLGSR